MADKEEPPYRILLPLASDIQNAQRLLAFAGLLAHALEGEVLVLQVRSPVEGDGGDRPHPNLDGVGVPHRLIEYEHESVASGILEVASEEQCDLILLYWRGQARAIRNRLGHILDPVLEEAPCDVALLEGELGELLPKSRFLVAMAGGPHADGAARLALRLADSYGGTVTLLTVLDEEASQEEQDEAMERLQALIRKHGSASQQHSDEAVPHAIRAPEVEPAIIEAANNHDLLFLGASSDSVLNQLLLGTVVERLAQAIPQPVLIVKRHTGVTQLWLRRLWRRLDQSLPNASAEDRLDSYKRLRRGARATADFYIMIFLSVVIATMGLLLDSGAVIIGAMLVAPLMSPILALGLAVVMGDLRLLRIAAQSTAQGILMAIVASVVLAWLSPFVIFTSEISGRTQPNLLDLTVALAAGAAGAYSVSRKQVAAALPGVAIAAALVPPLSVIGICLATSRWMAAAGATLLFSTNLVAISFAAAVVYVLLGFFPQEREERAPVLRRGLTVTLLLLFLLSIPLARTLARTTTQTLLDRTLSESLQQTLNQEATLSLFSIDWDRDAPPDQPLPVRLVVYAADEVSPETRQRLDAAITEAIGREVLLSLIIIPISELREAQPDEGVSPP